MRVDEFDRQPSSRSEEPDSGWNPAANPVVAELLDHIAEELAQEYVRLMKKAADAESRQDEGSMPEEEE